MSRNSGLHRIEDLESHFTDVIQQVGNCPV
jgi:hypothetical protein